MLRPVQQSVRKSQCLTDIIRVAIKILPPALVMELGLARIVDATAYQIATGFPGEPVAPTILSGDQTKTNS